MVPDGWSARNLGKSLERVSHPVDVLPDEQYTQIGVRSHGRGVFIKEPVTGSELGSKRVFHIEPECLVLNIVFAWEQAVSQTTSEHAGFVASHRFPMYRPRPGQCDVNFIRYFFLTRKGKHLLGLASPGGAGRNKTLGQKEFERLVVPLPPLPEQQKITEILSTWDKAIETTEKLLANAEAQKRALMQELLTGKRRLKGYVGEWKEVPIGVMGQVVGGGTPETVNPDYWEGGIPWATPTDITRLRSRFIGETARTLSASGLKNCAAKSLPPGTLLVCTRATVGELAIASAEITTNQGFKSLIPKPEHDVEFLYYLIAYYKHRLVRLACGSTFLELSKRDFERCSFRVPRRDEQAAIATILNAASDDVERLRDQGSILAAEKRALMQQLLTGKRRVTP